MKIIRPILIAILFSIVFSFYSLNRHWNFGTSAYDLGIYTQISYLYSQNILPFSSIKHMLLLGDHFEPILIPLSLIYKFFPDASTLLVLQSLFVSLSSIPIYLIAQDKLKKPLLSLLITLIYLTSTGILSAIHFDFHSTTISVLPISLTLYSWYFKKIRLYIFSCLFSLLFKEDLPIFILGLGIYQLFANEKKLALFSISFALISYVIIKVFLMSFLWPNSQNAYLSTSILPVTNPFDLIILLLLNPKIYINIFFNSPIKLNTFQELYSQFALLPLLSPLGWLTVFPELYFRFSSLLPHFWSNNWHYNANLEPFLAVSTILVIDKFKLPQKAISVLLIYSLIIGGLSPNSLIWSIFQTKQNNLNNYQSLLNSLPKNSAISAQSPLVPHLANREKIYMFPEIYETQYVILDTKLSTYPLTQKQLFTVIDQMKSSKLWKIDTQKNSLIIFKRQSI